MNSAASSASHPPPLSTRAAAIRAASLARGTSSAPLVSRGGELRTNDTESRAFIQLRGARTACVVAAAFSILVHTLLAHGVVVGSFWCPLSLCAEMCDEPAALTDSLRWQRRVLAAICLMLDFGVIATHWLMPVHPKFVVVKSRRRVMRAHLLSGCDQKLDFLPRAETGAFARPRVGTGNNFHNMPLQIHRLSPRGGQKL